MSFYDYFRRICLENNTTPTAVGNKLGIGSSTISNWKQRGSTPNAATLNLIADHFGVSPAYFFGEVQYPSKTEFVATSEEDLYELIERFRYDPAYRGLFKKTKNATPEDIQRIMDMIDLMKIGDNTNG